MNIHSIKSRVIVIIIATVAANQTSGMFSARIFDAANEKQQQGKRISTHAATTPQQAERPAAMWNGATSGKIWTSSNNAAAQWKWVAGSGTTVAAVWVIKKMISRGK